MHKTPWDYGFSITQSSAALDIDNTSLYTSSFSRANAVQVYHQPGSVAVAGVETLSNEKIINRRLWTPEEVS